MLASEIASLVRGLPIRRFFWRVKTGPTFVRAADLRPLSFAACSLMGRIRGFVRWMRFAMPFAPSRASFRSERKSVSVRTAGPALAVSIRPSRSLASAWGRDQRQVHDLARPRDEAHGIDHPLKLRDPRPRLRLVLARAHECLRTFPNRLSHRAPGNPPLPPDRRNQHPVLEMINPDLHDGRQRQHLLPASYRPMPAASLGRGPQRERFNTVEMQKCPERYRKHSNWRPGSQGPCLSRIGCCWRTRALWLERA